MILMIDFRKRTENNRISRSISLFEEPINIFLLILCTFNDLCSFLVSVYTHTCT